MFGAVPGRPGSSLGSRPRTPVRTGKLVRSPGARAAPHPQPPHPHLPGPGARRSARLSLAYLLGGSEEWTGRHDAPGTPWVEGAGVGGGLGAGLRRGCDAREGG